MPNFDDFKLAIEAMTGGKNTVLFDDMEMPSVSKNENCRNYERRQSEYSSGFFCGWRREGRSVYI